MPVLKCSARRASTSMGRRCHAVVPMLRPTLLCVQRVAPANAYHAEASAADFIKDVCAPGVYATLTTTAGRTMVHQLTKRCEKLATALELFRSGGAAPPPSTTAEAGLTFARSLQLALANDSSVRFLPGEELRITMHASPEDDALHLYVQQTPPPPGADAALSRPIERAAASVRDDALRGATGGWATPFVHPSLQPAPADESGGGSSSSSLEETLLHEGKTDKVVEGLNSNLFVVMNDGSLRTAGVSEGAYPGSVREAVLKLASESEWFKGVDEIAPTAAELADGAWREAWLTCASRKVAPLERIWQPTRGEWVEMGENELGRRMRTRLDEVILSESEPL